MNIRLYSSHFTLFVYTQNVDIGASLKVTLAKAGYDTYFFQNPGELFNKLQEAPCHILIFSMEDLGQDLSDFINQINEISPDIGFISLSDFSQMDVLTQYGEYGLMDIVLNSEDHLETRILWSVDRACEKIYLTMQNEQMLKQLEEIPTSVNAPPPTSTQEQSLDSTHEPTFLLASVIGDYRLSNSKEDLVQKFVSSLQKTSCVYFKYLPSVRSFVATHSSGIDARLLKGVGSQLGAEESKNLNTSLGMGEIPKSLKELLGEGFHFQQPRVLPLFVQSQLDGIIAFDSKLERKDLQEFHERFALFSLAYSHYTLEKKVDALEVQDYVTEIYNRSYYLRRLDTEFARAKRNQKPLALIKVAIDQIKEIESSLGESSRDLVLKSIATVLQKSGRGHDFSARTGFNELTIVLPECSKKGATIRAERLRKTIESNHWLDNGMKISVSMGVSEYPTLAASAEALDSSATKALVHIIEKGGNKLCLFKAPRSYQPEFSVAEE